MPTDDAARWCARCHAQVQPDEGACPFCGSGPDDLRPYDGQDLHLTT